MPIIEVWGLPRLPDPEANIPGPVGRSEEEILSWLYNDLAIVVSGISELGLRAEQVSVFFLPGRMKRGKEIVIRVWGVFEKPERTDEVRNRLAEAVGRAVKDCFPKFESVEVFVESFNPQRGFWSSAF